MSLEIEVLKFLMYLTLGTFTIWITGVFYGVNRKLGIGIILTGLITVLTLLVFAILNVDISTHEWSWGALIAGFIDGLMIGHIWWHGVGFGKKLIEERGKHDRKKRKTFKTR